MARDLLFYFALTAVAITACNRSQVARQIESTPLYKEAFSGFYLCDATTGEVLHQQNATKLFTPASNTKLFTLATCLAWLPQDSLPALAYDYRADTLMLWALAYPQLAADSTPYNQRIKSAIQDHPGPVALNLHGYWPLPRFGEGWMWDDYPYAFAREQSGFPMYRNLLSAWRREDDSSSSELASIPSFLVVRKSKSVEGRGLQRQETQGRYYGSIKISHGDTLYAPLYGVSSMASQLLEDWTDREIRYHNDALPTDWGDQTWRGEPRDSLLRRMMLPSDNFLAEHLLLQAGLYHDDITKPRELRERAQREVLRLAASELAWADASGISHYNLVTPQALGKVMLALYAELGPAGIVALFPTGGQSGTISDWYAGPEGKPYVWAKTGTLRHNHSLTGLLQAKSGRHLIFSMMHNHYSGSSTAYKKAMEETLLTIRDNY